MNIHEFYIFNLLGERSQKESMWSEKQLLEAGRLVNMFYPKLQFSIETTETKQLIIDEMCKLYKKYRANPDLIEGIFQKYQAD